MPDTPESFDLVVVGTGVAGTAVARKCRAAGWRVAIVDDEPFGGTCALRGCDPKKVLVGAAALVDAHHRMTAAGVVGESRIDWPALMRFKRTFTDPVPAKREAMFERAGMVTYHGRARFVADDRMLVLTSAGTTLDLRATHFVIACGAEPKPLEIAGEAYVRTSTDFLALEELPSRIAFIGAGYVSFEFAHIAQRAGAQTTVLGSGAPLAHFDQDLVGRLVAHSRAIGIDVRTEVRVTGVEQRGDGYRVHVASGRDGEQAHAAEIDVDLVVHGAGRVPRTRQLELANAHVDTDAHGAVALNQFLQSTGNARVYAAGDCALPPGSLPLTPVAAYEGSIVASNLLRGNARTPDYSGTPSVVFTVPPLAMVGLTERAARERGGTISVKCEDTTEWFSNRRVRAPVAMYKTIVDTETGRVLGAHLLGPDAADVINVFALAIRHGLAADVLRDAIYAYPTSDSDVSAML